MANFHHLQIKQGIRWILPLFLTTMILCFYQNCGQINSPGEKEDLSSLGNDLHTVSIQLTEAKALSASGRIEVSGTCDIPDKTLAEISWKIIKTSCSSCSSKTFTQDDGCINGKVGFSEIFSDDSDFMPTTNDKYRIEATLIPKNIPPENISDQSVKWDSIKITADIDNSVKPFIHRHGNLKTRDQINVGGEYEMNVDVESPVEGGTLTYEWYKGRTEINNEDSYKIVSNNEGSTLTLKPVNLTHEGQYKVRITLDGGGSVYSNILVLTVIRPDPLIENDLNEEDTAEWAKEHEMSVTVSADNIEEKDAEFTYQWYKGTEKINHGDKYEIVTNNTDDNKGSTLTIKDIDFADRGQYKVEIIITGGKKVTSNIQTLSVPHPVTIKKIYVKGEESGASININNDIRYLKAGKKYSLIVEASGKSLSYQWYKDDAEIGGTEPKFTIDSFSADNAGKYHVVITHTLNANKKISLDSPKVELGVQQ